jgi:hypothetical protein
MTRVIDLPGKRILLECCEQCRRFHKSNTLGFIPAYCDKEGRFLTEVLLNDGCGGPVGVGRSWHVIPHWCNVGTPLYKIEDKPANDDAPYMEYIITSNQLTALEETGSWNVVRAIAREIRSVQEVKSQEVKQP